MKSSYNLDLSEESSSLINTPSLLARQLPFFASNCGHFYANSGYFTEREDMDSYLLIYTVSGSGYLNYRGKEHTLKPGQICVINCAEYQYYKTGEEGNWELRWIHFNGSACKFYSDMINEDSLCVIELADASEINRHLNEITALILKDEINTDIRISMLLTNILTELAVNRHNPQSSKSYALHSKMLENAMDYMRCHYRQNIKARDLLKTTHVSEYYFMRLFRKYTGVSVYEYLTNYRLNKSKLLLKETNLTVYQIAFEVGFNNVNNYIRDFKKVVGTTPLKFRNHWVS